MQASLRPDEVFQRLNAWWRLHDSFGLAFVFSTDELGMAWLSRRMAEALPPPGAAPSPSHLSYQASYGNASAALFEKLDATSRVLHWIAPTQSDLGLCLRRMNESRQALIASKHLFVLCVPQSDVGAVDALAPDLWSVRSWVHVTSSPLKRHDPGAFKLAFGDPMSQNAVPASSVGPEQSSLRMGAWQTSYQQWQAAPAQNRKRLSTSLAEQAAQDAMHLRQSERALELLQQAVEVAQQQQQVLAQANALTLLGNLEHRLGRIAPAREQFTQSIALFEKEQHDLGRANALTSLGNLELRLGRIEPAREHFTQAIALYEKEQHDLGRANALTSLGNLELHLGRIEPAREHFTQAITLYEKEQHDLGRANALRSLGNLDLLLGRTEPAREHFTQAIALFKKEQDDLGLAYSWLGLACLSRPAAPAFAAKARQHAQASGLPPVIEHVESTLVSALHTVI
jgi:tetratricopeptide (TPR) repeat protein